MIPNDLRRRLALAIAPVLLLSLAPASNAADLDPAAIDRALREAHAKFAGVATARTPTTSPRSPRCPRTSSASRS